MACRLNDCVRGASFVHAMGDENGGNEIRGSAKFACIQNNSLLRALEDSRCHPTSQCEHIVSRFIVELVGDSLDLKEITGSYVSGLGQPPFDPRIMVALLLYSYVSGLYLSRRITKACRERNDFVMIVALDAPNFRTISDFRKRHLKALGGLFVQVLKLCETAGLVKLAAS